MQTSEQYAAPIPARISSKTRLKNLLLSSSFCYWVVFGVFAFFLVNFILLFGLIEVGPSPTNSYTSASTFSEESVYVEFLATLHSGMGDDQTTFGSAGWEATSDIIWNKLTKLKQSTPATLSMDIVKNDGDGFHLHSSFVSAYSGTRYIAVKLSSAAVSAENNMSLLIYSPFDSSPTDNSISRGKVGCGVMLELLDCLIHRNSHSFVIQHPLIFLFDGHSYALGSPGLNHFLKTSSFAENVKGFISLESIGLNGKYSLAESTSSGRSADFLIQAYGSSFSQGAFANSISSANLLTGGMYSPTSSAFNLLNSGGGSDGLPNKNSAYGIPGIRFSPIHTPFNLFTGKDNDQNIKRGSIQYLGNTLIQMIDTICNRPDFPSSSSNSQETTSLSNADSPLTDVFLSSLSNKTPLFYQDSIGGYFYGHPFVLLIIGIVLYISFFVYTVIRILCMEHGKISHLILMTVTQIVGIIVAIAAGVIVGLLFWGISPVKFFYMPIPAMVVYSCVVVGVSLLVQRIIFPCFVDSDELSHPQQSLLMWMCSAIIWGAAFFVLYAFIPSYSYVCFIQFCIGFLVSVVCDVITSIKFCVIRYLDEQVYLFEFTPVDVPRGLTEEERALADREHDADRPRLMDEHMGYDTMKFEREEREKERLERQREKERRQRRREKKHTHKHRYSSSEEMENYEPDIDHIRHRSHSHKSSHSKGHSKKGSIDDEQKEQNVETVPQAKSPHRSHSVEMPKSQVYSNQNTPNARRSLSPSSAVTSPHNTQISNPIASPPPQDLGSPTEPAHMSMSQTMGPTRSQPMAHTHHRNNSHSRVLSPSLEIPADGEWREERKMNTTGMTIEEVDSLLPPLPTAQIVMNVTHSRGPKIKLKNALEEEMEWNAKEDKKRRKEEEKKKKEEERKEKEKERKDDRNKEKEERDDDVDSRVEDKISRKGSDSGPPESLFQDTKSVSSVKAKQEQEEERERLGTSGGGGQGWVEKPLSKKELKKIEEMKKKQKRKEKEGDTDSSSSSQPTEIGKDRRGTAVSQNQTESGKHSNAQITRPVEEKKLFGKKQKNVTILDDDYSKESYPTSVKPTPMGKGTSNLKSPYREERHGSKDNEEDDEQFLHNFRQSENTQQKEPGRHRRLSSHDREESEQRDLEGRELAKRERRKKKRSRKKRRYYDESSSSESSFSTTSDLSSDFDSNYDYRTANAPVPPPPRIYPVAPPSAAYFIAPSTNQLGPSSEAQVQTQFSRLREEEKEQRDEKIKAVVIILDTIRLLFRFLAILTSAWFFFSPIYHTASGLLSQLMTHAQGDLLYALILSSLLSFAFLYFLSQGRNVKNHLVVSLSFIVLAILLIIVFFCIPSFTSNRQLPCIVQEVISVNMDSLTKPATAGDQSIVPLAADVLSTLVDQTETAHVIALSALPVTRISSDSNRLWNNRVMNRIEKEMTNSRGKFSSFRRDNSSILGPHLVPLHSTRIQATSSLFEGIPLGVPLLNYSFVQTGDNVTTSIGFTTSFATFDLVDFVQTHQVVYKIRALDKSNIPLKGVTIPVKFEAVHDVTGVMVTVEHDFRTDSNGYFTTPLAYSGNLLGTSLDLQTANVGRFEIELLISYKERSRMLDHFLSYLPVWVIPSQGFTETLGPTILKEHYTVDLP